MNWYSGSRTRSKTSSLRISSLPLLVHLPVFIYVTTIYYMYTGERDLTDKVTLNYPLITHLRCLTTCSSMSKSPVHTSWHGSLALQDPWYGYFYGSHDPLDNCVPSLHIAIPFGILALNWLHVREQESPSKNGTSEIPPIHFLNTFCLPRNFVLGHSLDYDIPLGIFVGGIGACSSTTCNPIAQRFRGDIQGIHEGKNWTTCRGGNVLLLFSTLLGSMAYQEETMNERIHALGSW